ncbi:GIY-YIG nuclease family protein [Niabella defluvii]|nr:GIY-YIG nuclease family protein [Niabella sp. I65]
MVASFDSLVKPIERIPPFITAMTGIDDAMVQDSPVFSEIAMEVFSMLNGRIFVAHNVNFDYSFIKHHLAIAGYHYKASKLCTIQLSRAIRPGLLSYSLGKLCDALEIELNNRHRAGGDADATVLLFQQLLQWDIEGVVPAFLERGNIEPQVVPDTLRDDFEQVPNKPGVYYFHNDKGQAVYVGKANDLKKRVAQHFKRKKR